MNSDWSWFYNAFVNSHNRNPLAKTNTVFVNNVNYNYEAAYTTHTGTDFKHDIVNNYFVFGPASTGTDNTWFQVDKNQAMYYSGNVKDKTLDGTLSGSETTPSWYQGPGTILTAPWSPVTTSVPAYSAATAFRLVTSRSGALPYDQMDSLVWSQVNTLGKGAAGQGAGTTGPASLYTSQVQTGLGNNGYESIASGTRATDTDNDGMPDFWEIALGSDPKKDDAMTVGADGYTLVEGYLNWLGGMHARVPNSGAIDVDLRAHTQGFKSVSPTYTVANPVLGTAVVGPNGTSARFTPKANATGAGFFDFTVKGSDGTSYTGTVSVLVEPGLVGVRGGQDLAASSIAEAIVVWVDLRGRVLLREIQHLDRMDPRPVVPSGMTGMRVARVKFGGLASVPVRELAIRP